MPYMKTMTYRRRAEIAAIKQSPFMPHRGLAASKLFLDTMLDRKTWEACPIDYRKALCNIYGNESQTCHLKGKTYRDAQLEELVHSVVVEHAPEHEVVCGSKPIGEKHGEGKTVIEWQSPRASGCEVTTPS
jgi:hypothetical protein